MTSQGRSLWAMCRPSHFSHVQLFATLWTVACEAPLSMRFSKQEYQSGCHAHLQGIFPTQGSNLHRLCLSATGLLTNLCLYFSQPARPALIVLNGKKRETKIKRHASAYQSVSHPKPSSPRGPRLRNFTLFLLLFSHGDDGTQFI